MSKKNLNLPNNGVTVFTMNFCPYCEKAKQLLKSRGISFTEIKVQDDDDETWDLLLQASGLKTMPQIFNGQKVIGGYTDLYQLDQGTQLQTLK